MSAAQIYNTKCAECREVIYLVFGLAAVDFLIIHIY